MIPIQTGGALPLAPLDIHPDAGQEATSPKTTSPVEPQRVPSTPPRPDAPAARARANSLQSARFAQAASAGGAAAVRPSQLPAEALDALSVLSKGNDLPALDTALKHLPSASPKEKVAIAAAFVKHGLKREDSPDHLEHLDHLYDALGSVTASDPKAAKALIAGLLAYGVGYLPTDPEDKRGPGLGRIADAIETLSLKQGVPEKGQGFVNNKAQLAEVAALIETASQTFVTMSAYGLVEPEVGLKLNASSDLNAAAGKAHDLALVHRATGMKLSNEEAQGALDVLNLIKNESEKAALADALLPKLNQLEPAQAAQFVSTMQAAVQGIDDEAARVSSLRQLAA
jgi:hypothetical protein